MYVRPLRRCLPTRSRRIPVEPDIVFLVAPPRIALPVRPNSTSVVGRRRFGLAGFSKADRIEKKEGGFVFQFHQVLASVRAMFKFGNGRIVARSVAKQMKVRWRSPLVPHSAGTRAVVYESSRCPANLLVNFRCAVYSLRFREREIVEDARREYARDHDVGPKAGWISAMLVLIIPLASLPPRLCSVVS